MKRFSAAVLLVFLLICEAVSADAGSLGNTNANMICGGIAVAGEADTVYFVDGEATIKSVRADEVAVVYQGSSVSGLNFYDGALYFLDSGNIMTMRDGGKASVLYKGDDLYGPIDLLIVDGTAYFHDLECLWAVGSDGNAVRIFEAPDELEWCAYEDGAFFAGTCDSDGWDSFTEPSEATGLWRIDAATGEATCILKECITAPVFSDGVIYCMRYDGVGDAFGIYRIGYDGTILSRLADGPFYQLNMWNNRFVGIYEYDDDNLVCVMSPDHTQRTVIEDGVCTCVVGDTLYYIYGCESECRRIDLTAY